MSNKWKVALAMTTSLAIGAVGAYFPVKRDVVPDHTELVGNVQGKAAQAQDGIAMLKDLKAKGFESDPRVLKALATGGQPAGRWTEGLTFKGVEPMPWLKSGANWYPNTEKVQPDEIRVTFMGSSPLPRPGKWARRSISNSATARISSSTWDRGRSPTISLPACRSTASTTSS